MNHLNIPSWPQSSAREEELLRSVLQSPQWGGFHPIVTEFERQFASAHQSKHGICAFNGTVTLEAALDILGIGAGHEVIVPAISFISTASAVSRVGATPVFVDIGSTSFNIDPSQVASAVTPRTKAVIPVHFGGTMADMEAINTLAREHGFWVIEDAAHAHGSEWKGKRAGSFGITGSFSFQNGKVMCSGEGGILVTDNDDFATQARSFINMGRKAGESFYSHYQLGTNFRMSAFQAAVLTAQLERLPEQIAHRTANVRLLKRLLADVDEIVWQDEPPAVTQNSWYLLCGRFRSKTVTRDEFHARVTAAGVPCTPFYPHTLYQNPLYAREDCRVMPCPNAEAYLTDAFWFPHRLLLADEETIHEAAEIIGAAARGKSKVSRDRLNAARRQAT
jgi:dTDP-4-amino-4,6-dideoxygalactose transaminase